jgi:pimeloyl-ACP methyl ester carboxylesterase
LNRIAGPFLECYRRMTEPAQPRKLVDVFHLLRLLLWGLLLFYLVAGAIVSFNQRWFIYVPPVYSARQMDELAQAANLQRWTNAAGLPIGMKRPSPRQPAQGSVLILYGNGSCTVNCARYADDLQALAPLDVFILEYPGYADRPGSPSQITLTLAADNALQMLPTNRPIYLIGESLGSGVAAHLAGAYPQRISGVVLLSPFNRLTDVAQYHMPIFPVHMILLDRFPAEDDLRRYHGPLGVMVDGKDQVVPEKFGRELYRSYAGPKQLWEFPDGGHITIGEPPAKFWGQVLQFWQTNTSVASK